uniref:Activator of Hsp90 ATPase AHSA1-like N-terminal domain-containing protein n=1 Tax=Timema douglasi TaxID=61478 RepID=A0A7R8VHL9_TIMDO|nr:unnamed protein product [Timema douglasi]
MAKWGEGDPRWIVEERPDATNVNNWHWTEKNACAWSVDKLKELLVNLPMESDIVQQPVRCKLEGGAHLTGTYHIAMEMILENPLRSDASRSKLIQPTKCKVTEIEKCEGEAVVNNRKGKLIFFYEWDLKIKWKGSLKDEDEKEIEGSAHIPNLSEENDVSDLDVRMQTNNRPSDNVTSSNLYTTTLNLGHNFQCTAEEFYNAMTVLELVQAFTRGPVKLEAEVGGKFELFGGNIHGDFVELVPNKKIVQRWRSKRWPAEHYSTVTFTIEQKDDHTEVRVLQIGVPQSEADSTRENWEYYYWDSVKRTFGFGSFIV